MSWRVSSYEALGVKINLGEGTRRRLAVLGYGADSDAPSDRSRVPGVRLRPADYAATGHNGR